MALLQGINRLVQAKLYKYCLKTDLYPLDKFWFSAILKNNVGRASFYRQFPITIKMKIMKIIPVFLARTFGVFNILFFILLFVKSCL